MKTLRQILEMDDPKQDLYKPKAKGEQDFKKLHKVDKLKDRNGNDEEYFTKSKVKETTAKKGYNRDEQPFRESEDLNEDVQRDIHDKYLNGILSKLEELKTHLSNYKKESKDKQYLDSWEVKNLHRNLEDTCDTWATKVENLKKFK